MRSYLKKHYPAKPVNLELPQRQWQTLPTLAIRRGVLFVTLVMVVGIMIVGRVAWAEDESTCSSEPDLTASQLQFDLESFTLGMRINNIGTAPSPKTLVSFYDGDPKNGGTFIESTIIGAIEPGAYQDLPLEEPQDIPHKDVILDKLRDLPNNEILRTQLKMLIGDEIVEGLTKLAKGNDLNIYVFVDADEQVSECNETNNIVSKIVSIGPCRAFGKVFGENGNPIEGATMQVGDETVLSDATGSWEIAELADNDYTLTISKDGYTFETEDFSVGDQQCNVDLGESNGMVALEDNHREEKDKTQACDVKTITGTITADNAYALYYGSPSEINLVGYDAGNQISVWKTAEEYDFVPHVTDYIYIAAWDYGSIQGLLAEFTNGNKTISTGEPAWQVYSTGVTLQGITVTPPSTSDLLVKIEMANTENDWNSVAVGAENSVAPWGVINGFTKNPKWIWQNKVCDGNLSPFAGDCNNEYLIFRLPVSELTSCETLPSCLAFGKVLDKHNNPIEGATTQVGNKTALTDATGFWEIPGLSENNDYTLTISKDGYSFESQDFQVGDEQQQCANVDLGNSKGASLLSIKVVPDSWEPIKLGDNVTYTITVTNEGSATATGVALDYTLPEGANLVSIETLDGGSCDADSINCTLPDLTPGGTANVKVVVTNTQPGNLVSTVTASSNEYPIGFKKASKKVKPYLSVSISDSPDPVQMQNVVHYTVDVDLSHYSPSAATGVELVTTLPSGVEFKSVNTDYGVCDISTLPTMTCAITDLSVDETDTVSHVTVYLDVELQDAGLLMLTTGAKVTANEHPAHTDTERTKIFIPDDVEVDIAFVIDVTGSMQGEINGVIKAIKDSIAKIDPNDAPLVALIVFTDDVKVKAFTSDLDVLLKAVENLRAAGGGKCPEASADALLIAIPHTKPDGNILFATDASPYENADIDKITELLRGKSIRFNAMITGDCTNPDSWNDLPSAE